MSRLVLRAIFTKSVGESRAAIYIVVSTAYGDYVLCFIVVHKVFLL